ncbi:uncharacterized protein ACA1_037500 [Acanthamoeba castellanii str. Neff]|uniref:Uncharacterized protein n=1 Tax=Acanthamoeba castellanii (strain ATCC 30010 / Neff) TaxID=1257118 RepID=L8H3A0_ACACF|nr:uncharacterized protein ACA1_037500 [Acanthamoeba castellanii str. Neff]ELR18896.1 hypothetical protein ACA1_037500 [Acanthamoeba castellanii str. Neff]
MLAPPPPLPRPLRARSSRRPPSETPSRCPFLSPPLLLPALPSTTATTRSPLSSTATAWDGNGSTSSFSSMLRPTSPCPLAARCPPTAAASSSRRRRTPPRRPSRPRLLPRLRLSSVHRRPAAAQARATARWTSAATSTRSRGIEGRRNNSNIINNSTISSTIRHRIARRPTPPNPSASTLLLASSCT